MRNKMTARKKPFNKFRFVGLFQKKISIKRTPGNEFEDYQNRHWLYCAKQLVRPMERSILEAQKISADIKIKCRYFNALSNGDRVVFLNDQQKSAKIEDIVRISSFGDQDGRKEYLTIMGAYGAFAGPAPIQPSVKNRIVLKALAETEAAINSAVDLRWNQDKPTAFYNSGGINLDLFIINRADNMFLSQNAGQNPAFPLIMTTSDFSAVVAKDVSAPDTEIPFAKLSTRAGLNIWAKPDFLIQPGSRKLLLLRITE